MWLRHCARVSRPPKPSEPAVMPHLRLPIRPRFRGRPQHRPLCLMNVATPLLPRLRTRQLHHPRHQWPSRFRRAFRPRARAGRVAEKRSAARPRLRQNQRVGRPAVPSRLPVLKTRQLLPNPRLNLRLNLHRRRQIVRPAPAADSALQIRFPSASRHAAPMLMPSAGRRNTYSGISHTTRPAIVRLLNRLHPRLPGLGKQVIRPREVPVEQARYAVQFPKSRAVRRSASRFSARAPN